MNFLAALKRDNRQLVVKLAVIVALMFGFGYALVPLYRAICEALGINVLALAEGDGRKLSADEVRRTLTAYHRLLRGELAHLAGELLNDMAGIDTVHVPYKGGAPALQDLLGERVAAYYATLSTAGPHIETGKLRPLAKLSISVAALPGSAMTTLRVKVEAASPAPSMTAASSSS